MTSPEMDIQLFFLGCILGEEKSYFLKIKVKLLRYEQLSPDALGLIYAAHEVLSQAWDVLGGGQLWACPGP